MKSTDHRQAIERTPFFEELHDVANAHLLDAHEHSEGLFRGTVSKAWMLPDHRIVRLGGLWHYKWALANRELVEDFGVDPAVLDGGEDTPIRLACLVRGFVRINYVGRQAQCTLEAGVRRWNLRKSNALFMVVLNNLTWINQLTVSLLGPGGEVVKSGTELLGRSDDDKEKLDRLPIIGESTTARRMAGLRFGLL